MSSVRVNVKKMQDKVFKIIEWILFILLITTSGWFASGVLQHFFSRKTSFSQHVEEVSDYPVISIILWHPKVNPCDVKIKYKASGMADHQYLEVGENQLHNKKKYNKTEKVLLQIFKNGTKYNNSVRVAYRILHLTPILKKNMVKVEIQMEYYIENKTIPKWWYDQVSFLITSQKNSPGSSLWKWKDGKQMQIAMNKNNFIQYSIQPQIIKYLQENDKCQEEPYYECITSQLDAMKFIECSKKCIPNVFSNLGKNYSTPFCQNDMDNEKCAFEIIEQIQEQEIMSDCKKACSILEYTGKFVLNMPIYSDKGKNWNMYFLRYRLNDFETMVHEEYIIYDTVGMIGSVGGTFGTYLFLKKQFLDS